jgi:TRAP-type transport system periplasmic protein
MRKLQRHGAEIIHSMLSSIALCLLAGPVGAQVIKLGTIAPEGSIWHDVMLETRQQWQAISNGEIELRIYAGGTLGGEDEMIRKMQRQTLDALTISGAGLPLVDNIVDCLQMPMLFDDYDEIERIRKAVWRDIEQSFESHGYKLINWSQAGWVHFFTKTPVRSPDELKPLRMWISSGAPENERLFKQLGFRVVPLPVTDMLTGLETGLIEAIDVPPLFALLDRSYQAAPFMTDLKFAPLNAATVVTLAAWQRIPAKYHEAFLAAAQTAADALRTEVPQAERDAIEEMSARGLTVVRPQATDIESWRNAARAVYPELGCNREHPALYERILALSGGDH